MTARELAARHGLEIGCGDNSCVFGAPGGMGTNGGCRCVGMRGLRVSNVSQDELDEMRRLVKGLAAVLRAIAGEEQL